MFSKQSLQFLSDLKENDNKIWFDTNRKTYDNLRKELITFSTEIIKAISKWDEGYKDLDPKKCLFRINRDIRFAKDKSPYKTNMGVWFSKGGKDWVRSGYYFHLEPGKSFVAGGSYEPFPPQLKAIRQEIDYNLPEFEKIVTSKDFKKHFGGMGGRSLKTVPKGYDKENPAIEYLKLQDFIVTENLSDATVLTTDIVKTCAESFKASSVLNNFLDRAMEEVKQ